MLRIEIDGGPATPEQVASGLLANYGHFTAMQVRDRRVRGLELHLRRLDSAHRELYGQGLTGVADLVSHALADDVRDASVRVTVFGLDEPTTMVTVRPPHQGSSHPHSLLPVRYTRPLPHVKHIGGFGQLLHGRRAVAAGFDDALLTTPDDVVVESAIANIGFVRDGRVVWPQADWLHGITMRLLEREVPSHREVVRLADLRSFQAAFLSNSNGVVPVSRVGEVDFDVTEPTLTHLRTAYDAIPQDPFD
ncbi:aminotransferase class IV [Saccharothrix coeruleofusca]|uniref:Branched-subunit amino acid aminotransferase/4-amino-4-deoxychorismate lyase n=1 Tax=Saccharothrix coeruleofusca TaxID=33919 RepID=A0A918AXB8_9PSEU|nr:aminotransferase class IV [Saccharothrix coeruleofusca]GGP84198.1 hypothetical protein GCM10010185_67620 [Saccharothrix coeruleofusca]